MRLEALKQLLACGPVTGSCLQVDLADLELETGAATAEAVNLLRSKLDMGMKVTLVRCPQMLAHNLYRVGLLNHPNLNLEETNFDEPQSS